MSPPKLKWLFLVAAVFLWAHPLRAQDCEGRLAFSKVQKGGRTYFYALNKDRWWPIHLAYNFSLFGNAEFSAPLPGRLVLRPRQKALLGWIRYKPGPGRSGYHTDFQYGFGDPAAVPDPKAFYLFPYPHGVKHGIRQGYFGHITHQGCYCLDFDLAENSPVCAARSGLVVMVKQDSDVGGSGPEFKKDGNFICILQADGTWAQYVHLRKNGARVRPGQRVAAGQLIGYSGHTGEASGPHLHFEVDHATWNGPSESIPTRFLVQGGETVSPVEGKYYYSYHPGKPPFREIKADQYTEAALDRYILSTPLNGAVTLRSYTLDSKTLFYGLNGTGRDQTLILQFPDLKNLRCSKPLPYTRVIPAGKEVYLLSLQIIDPEERSFYRAAYRYR